MNAATAEFSPLARNVDEAHACLQGNMLQQKARARSRPQASERSAQLNEHVHHGEERPEPRPDPSALRADHALAQRHRRLHHAGIGLADLQCLAAICLRLSAEPHAWRLARGGTALALRGHVVVRRQWPPLSGAGTEESPLPPQVSAAPGRRRRGRSRRGAHGPAQSCRSRRLQCGAKAFLPRGPHCRPRHRRLGPRPVETGAVQGAGSPVRWLRGRPARAFFCHGQHRAVPCHPCADGGASTAQPARHDPWSLRERLMRRARTRVAGVDAELLVNDAARLLPDPSRRRFLRQVGSLGALAMLTGCDITDAPSAEKTLRKISEFNDWVQARLFNPNRLATTYPDSAVTRPFPFNAYYAEAEAPDVDEERYRLILDGLIANKQPWTLEQLAGLPQQTQITRLVCVEGWSAIGKWTGVPLRSFLERIGADLTAKYVHFVCAEGYFSSIDMPT